MKSLLKRFVVAASALLVFAACQKEEEKLILDFSAVPVVSVSAPSVVLVKENADKDALTISWPKPNYGYNAAANYTIMIDKKGGDFSKAASMNVGTGLSKTFKGAELNSLLLGLGLTPATAADIDVKVMSALGGRTILSSALATVKTTPYLDRLDLSSPWGLVGSATANGWDGPDQPFYKTETPGIFVAYVNLIDGDIKIRQDNKWEVNYGGSAGKLSAGGDNIKVTAGTYKVTFNLNASSYAVEKFSWGVVGDATLNGWNGPDQNLTYDPSTDQWFTLTTLKAGDIKIRQNNDWAVNYGGSAGKLSAGGDNIKITTPGTYLIVADLKPTGLKYTLTATKVWGLVGDATPNGWDGPDQAFRPDLSKDGVWTLTGVKLKVGEMKVRADNKWDTNYGDDGANGTLELNGANLKVAAAGTYDILLDFSNATAPKITITKK
ncbi:SusE domain-containing protein [Fibrivirga algicola]|uniref:SusF/SusE family outer membrane protein n=1 Tax=Fibrivirga algicola TaxID=2950420 RepID=A0ABX0QFU1_9BACT|nr:SusE domain-containing protein [Fibrivirga algicola]NID11041.1 SusF/SusE family outer membrane protein [Fibrivirga algicola]